MKRTLFMLGIVTLAVASMMYRLAQPQMRDAQRVSDMAALSDRIADHSKRFASLPPILSLLNNQGDGYQVPLDPLSSTAYGYEMKGQRSYILCATFETAYAPIAQDTIFWRHPAGRHCYQLSTGPEDSTSQATTVRTGNGAR